MGKDFHAEAAEYNQVETKLKTLHNQQKTQITKTYNTLRKLADPKGIFVMDQTSAKLRKVLDMVDQRILPALAVVFANAEKNVDKFISEIERIDQE